MHGALAALESAGIQAQAYSCASSSTLPVCGAVVGETAKSGPEYWIDSIRYVRAGKDMSSMVRWGIDRIVSGREHEPFQAGRPRLIVLASRVITTEAAAITQGAAARRLGRQLLLDASRQDSSWADRHLRMHLFDSHSVDPATRLHAGNLSDVLYASTRMLHAWDIPAWVGGAPYVDASYTCLCAAVEMASLGYDEVIAISNEPDPFYKDMFRRAIIPTQVAGATIHVIQPDVDVRTMGVDYADAGEDALREVYAYGQQKARDFLRGWLADPSYQEQRYA